MWKGRGYYGGGEGKATEAEMKIQVNVHATEVFIFIRDSRYSPEIERSENAIYLSKDQAKEFARTCFDDSVRKRFNLDHRRTTRSTGAAVACFASSVVRRRLHEFAPPPTSAAHVER